MVSHSFDDNHKEALLKNIVEDKNVQFYWALITPETREDIAQNVLYKICQLMLTIRGFSTAAAYMEEFKQSQKKMTKKGLRKELKKYYTDD